ncbi:MAG: hypothetical protein K0V04_09335 [Deltaproteobacteria bacterium]|nr:hypothetical protein [Deltaproteobacteria bacterium]
MATAGLIATVIGCGGGDDGPPAWDPEQGADDAANSEGPASATTDDGGDAGETLGNDGTSDAPACDPGDVVPCGCPDGDGEQTCDADGSGYGPCECDDEGTTADSGGSTGGEPPTGDEVCYPGQSGDYTTCLPLHSFEVMPEGYDYPEPFQGNDNYRAPIALIDLEEVDPGTYLAPNFQLDEIAQLYKGRYAVVQPHAIESLQQLRDQVGAITVNSAYRSPGYNAGIPGSAQFSRHMYGDAYDLDPLEVGLTTLENLCVAENGMLVEYNTHVHCDFRFDPVDEQFFGPPNAAADPQPTFAAVLVFDGERWTAPAEGFDEGEPLRRWLARDGSGQVLTTAVGHAFAPPAGTTTVEVTVGAQVVVAAELGIE